MIGNLIVEMQINPHFTFKSDREFDRESREIRRKKSVGIPKFSIANQTKQTDRNPAKNLDINFANGDMAICVAGFFFWRGTLQDVYREWLTSRFAAV